MAGWDVTGGGGLGKCVYAKEGGQCCFVMNKDKRGNGQKGRDRCAVFKHLPAPVYAEGGNGCLIPLHFYYSCT